MQDQEVQFSPVSSGNADTTVSPQAAAFELVFPPDHVLCKLQALWADSQEPAAPVCLSLLSNTSAELTPFISDPSRELKRLHILLNHVARSWRRAPSSFYPATGWSPGCFCFPPWQGERN